VATNRHVVDALTMGTGRLASGQAVIRFGLEFNVVPDPKAVAIVEVRALHPDLDLALLRIEPVDPAPSPFVPRATAADAGTPVATIGYPAEDPRNPYFVGLLFGASLGVKRVAPGEVTEARGSKLFHDCTTLGGNSGSPVLALDDGGLVGVHTDGFFLARNQAVTSSSAFDFLTVAPGAS